MSVPRWEAMLPSVDQLARVDAAIDQRLSGLDDPRRDQVVDALGALGLYLAQRAPNAWLLDEASAYRAAGGPETQAPGDWLDDATRCGLLIREGGSVRPADRLTSVRLAARRLAAAGLGPEALSDATCGMRFEMTAMALSEVQESEGSEALVALPEGPLEDLSGATAALRLHAMALGVSVPDGLRAGLLDAALEWTGPDGRETHAVASAAALAAELRRGGTHATRVKRQLEGRHLAILEVLRQEHEPGVTGLLRESLGWTFEALVASQGGDREGVHALFEASGGFRRLLIDALGRALSPDDETDAWRVELVGRALEAGEHDAIGGLAYGEGPSEMAEELMLSALVRARTQDDHGVVEQAVEASAVLTGWSHLPDPLAYALSRLVVSEAHPLVRVAASHALGHHPDAAEVYEAVLLPTVAHLLRHAREPAEQAVAAAASMSLGSDDIMAPSMAVALIADGISPGVFSPSLAHGLWRNPQLVAGVLQALVQEERPPRLAATAVLEDTVAIVFGHIRGAGDALNPRVPGQRAVEQLLNTTLPYVGDVSDPALSAGAARVCAGLGRGREHVAQAIVVARQVATGDEDLASALNVAIGTAGVPGHPVVRDLGLDVVGGAPSLAMHAAMGLALIGEHQGDYQALDDSWRHRLRVQASVDPAMHAFIQTLCYGLNRKPIGDVWTLAGR